LKIILLTAYFLCQKNKQYLITLTHTHTLTRDDKQLRMKKKTISHFMFIFFPRLRRRITSREMYIIINIFFSLVPETSFRRIIKVCFSVVKQIWGHGKDV